MTALVTDDKKKFISPYPVIDNGPKTITAIPPPIKIRIHIPNKKPNNPTFKS